MIKVSRKRVERLIARYEFERDKQDRLYTNLGVFVEVCDQLKHLGMFFFVFIFCLLWFFYSCCMLKCLS